MREHGPVLMKKRHRRDGSCINCPLGLVLLDLMLFDFQNTPILSSDWAGEALHASASEGSCQSCLGSVALSLSSQSYRTDNGILERRTLE